MEVENNNKNISTDLVFPDVIVRQEGSLIFLFSRRASTTLNAKFLGENM